ncbi:MAG: type I polyketide synthase [Opitutales bacterium]
MLSTRDKIAIIGIGCRFPPKAHSPEAFWRFLLRSGNAIREVPESRWNAKAFFDPDPERPGKTYVSRGGFLDYQPELFDPLAFGVSPREAESMDPQQRLLLETAWEAFDDAGIPQEALRKSNTGVFVGGFCLDHLIHFFQPENLPAVTPQTATGITLTVLANRLSHVFDLRGPSFSLDTACSSSLVALHLGCQSLAASECDVAIVGGVNSMTRPEFGVVMSKGRFLSPHGECRTFDESAAGYSRGEGAGVLVLKRLDRALEDQDDIHAVIRGTAINQDGHTPGLSLPNGDAQAALMRALYERIALDPAEVDYVEAHGTGTKAGDPLEVGALDNVLGARRAPDRKLWVGSVKSNIGHLEAGAGVAGIIKAIGTLKLRKVFPNLHFKSPNPALRLDQRSLRIPTAPVDLPGVDEKPTLFVGVNSFGYGGTNAHAVLESAPPPRAAEASQSVDQSQYLIPLSAKSPEALREAASKLAFQLSSSSFELKDIAYTSAFRRSHLDVRAAVIAQSLEELRDACSSLFLSRKDERIVHSYGGGAAGAQPAFLFSGMGPQWWGMGQELYRTHPVVRATFQEVDAVFYRLAGWSLLEAMLAPEAESRMHQTRLAQPANFCLQIALVRMLASWGVTPAAVVGHSVGEVAAAYVAGIYTLEEAVLVSFHRSRLQQTTAGLGGMLAAGVSEDEAVELLRSHPNVAVAAINSPSSLTLAGDSAQLMKLSERLTKDGRFNKALRVEVAYHSPQMDPIREELLQCLEPLRPKVPTLPIYSTAFGRESHGDEWTNAYWWQNVRGTVRFADAMKAMFSAGWTCFIEVGPHPVLSTSVQEIALASQRKVAVLETLNRKTPETTSVGLLAGRLYCQGENLNWAELAPVEGCFVRGATYPFQRHFYWRESVNSRSRRLGKDGPSYHHQRIAGLPSGFEVEVNRNFFPFLEDHRVQRQVVFPGMGYVEAMIEYGASLESFACLELKDIAFEKVFTVDPKTLQYLQTHPSHEGQRIEMRSRTVDPSREDLNELLAHAGVTLLSQPEPPKLSLDETRQQVDREVSLGEIYEFLERSGLSYGQCFRCIQEAHFGKRCFWVRLTFADIQPPLSRAHPTLLDAAIQPVLFAADRDQLYVPVGISRVFFHKRLPRSVLVCGHISRVDRSFIVADVEIYDPEGTVLISIQELVCQQISAAATDNASRFYELVWTATEPLAAPEAATVPPFVIVTEEEFTDHEMIEHLARADGCQGTWQLPDEIASDIAWTEFGTGICQAREIVVAAGSQFSSPASPSAFESLSWKLVRLAKAVAASTDEQTRVTFLSRRTAQSGSAPADSNYAAAVVAALSLLISNEAPQLTCQSLEVASAAAAISAAQVLAELCETAAGHHAWDGSQRWVQQLKPTVLSPQPMAIPEDAPIATATKGRGRIEDLCFVPAREAPPGPGEVAIGVDAAGIAYKDLLKLLGRIHHDAYRNTFFDDNLGMDISGLVLAVGPDVGDLAVGDHVFGFSRGGLATRVIADARLLTKIREEFSSTAAGVPLNYLTAYIALIDKAHLATGASILIHNAAGGLGQAALAIARKLGLVIFATAGSDERREWLKELGIEHVFDSRSLDFVTQIRRITAGQGLDAVLSAQTGPVREASFDVLATDGHYLDVGKKDLNDASTMPLKAFNRGLSYSAIDLSRLLRDRPLKVRQGLLEIRNWLEDGTVQPPHVKGYGFSQVHEAFKELAQNRHRGKIIVRMNERPSLFEIEPQPFEIDRSDKAVYIVTGGGTGFGLKCVHWLVAHGARHVIIAARRGASTPGLMSEIASLPAKVEPMTCDVTEPEAVAGLNRHLEGQGLRLRGIIHAAMVLDDGMLAEITRERFLRVLRPKIRGAKNLIDHLPTVDLQFCIFTSSVSAVIGNRGQASYVAANTFLDTFAHELRQRGVPALSINLGALKESGVVADSDGTLEASLTRLGVHMLPINDVLRDLPKMLGSRRAQVAYFDLDWQKWQQVHTSLRSHLRFGDVVTPEEQDGSRGFAAALAKLSQKAQHSLVSSKVQHAVSSAVGLPEDAVPENARLADLGIDSLILLELIFSLYDVTGIRLSAIDVMKAGSVSSLAVMLLERLAPSQ